MLIPDISKRPWKNIDIVVTGLLDVMEGLGRIFSLGFWIPDITMSYLYWRSMKMLDRQNALDNQQKMK